MPPLTWRDTVQPDFSNTLAGIRQTGDALNRGLGGIGDALGKFNDYSQGQNAAALMANAVKYTNPADLQAAFADGSIMKGVNPSYLAADALKATQGQVGTLLNNATATEANKYAASADPLLIHSLQDKDTLNAGTLAARIAQPALQNDATRANIGFTGAQTTGLGIANDQATRMNPLLVDQQAERNRGLNITNDAGQLGLTQAQRQDSDTLAARPFINQLSAAQDADGVNRILGSPEAQALSPGARAQLIAASQASPNGSAIGSGGGASGTGGSQATRAIAGAVAAPGAGLTSSVYEPTSSAGSAAPSAPGTAGTKQGSLYDTTYGNKATPVPVSDQKIGDVVDYGKKALIPQTGHSPTGAYQIVAGTLEQYGPKVFGPDWRNVTYSPENQDKLGQAIFEDNKNGNLKAQWDSLPDATPGAYANKTWAQMRGIITKGEVGKVDPSASGAGSAPGTAPNASNSIDAALAKIKSDAERVAITAAGTNRSLAAGDAQKRSQAPEASIYSPTTVNDTDKNGQVTGQHMLQAAINDTTTSIGDVAAQMANSGSYKGVAPEALANMIQKIQQDAGGVSPMAAKAIMEAHPQNASWIMRNMPYWAGGYNSVPDAGAIHQASLAARNGTLEQTNMNSVGSSVIQQKITDANQVYQNASKQLALATRTPTMADQIPGLQGKVDAAKQLFDSIQKPAWNQDSLHPVFKDENGNVISRHNTAAVPAQGQVPAPMSATSSATPAATSTPTAGPTPTIAPSIPGRDSADPDVQAARSKVQAALDRLTVARGRNDPKAKAYAQTYNRTTQALQDAIDSSSQNIPSSIQGRD